MFKCSKAFRNCTSFFSMFLNKSHKVYNFHLVCKISRILICISCLLFTEIAKYSIGRLRPHFLTVCNPEYTDDLCRDPNNPQYTRFVIENQDELCRLENGHTEKHLKEARLSFLSGHSSLSFFCATFMIVYLQSRLNRYRPQGCLSLNYFDLFIVIFE